MRWAVTSCPYHVGAVSSVPTAQEAATPVFESCPVIGTAPHVACPIETHVKHHSTPTMMQMVSQMGKTHLSAYVAATALAGYVLAGGVSPMVVTVVTAGVMLQSCSANTANQVIEAPYDKLMKRTCRRPLPMKHITPQLATSISAVQLAVGTGMLYTLSPVAAGLGLLNWFLYVCVYTPLKRVSALNTWFGAIVGGIPPLMGAAVISGPVPGSVGLLAFLLFVWQIPHFNGLAFHCRRDYEAAGYKMLAFYNPWRASFYAVTLSVLMAALTLVGPICVDMPVEGAWYYPVTTAANAVMLYKSILFHRDPVRHCRGCFVFSYVYLSIILAALMLNHIQPIGRITKGFALLVSDQPEEVIDAGTTL